MDVPNTPFLTRRELAERLRLKPRTLAAWSAKGKGPQCCIIGSRVLYRLDGVVAWERQQRDCSMKAQQARRSDAEG